MNGENVGLDSADVKMWGWCFGLWLTDRCQGTCKDCPGRCSLCSSTSSTGDAVLRPRRSYNSSQGKPWHDHDTMDVIMWWRLSVCLLICLCLKYQKWIRIKFSWSVHIGLQMKWLNFGYLHKEGIWPKYSLQKSYQHGNTSWGREDLRGLTDLQLKGCPNLLCPECFSCLNHQILKCGSLFHTQIVPPRTTKFSRNDWPQLSNEFYHQHWVTDWVVRWSSV